MKARAHGLNSLREIHHCEVTWPHARKEVLSRLVHDIIDNSFPADIVWNRPPEQHTNKFGRYLRTKSRGRYRQNCVRANVSSDIGRYPTERQILRWIGAKPSQQDR
jgi:hypothetical protein